MSKRTIRMVDLMCDIANWNGCIRSVAESLTDGVERWPSNWKAEARNEIRLWTKRRDRSAARLRVLAERLTPEELDLIRRRYRPDFLRRVAALTGPDVRIGELTEASHE